MSDTHDKAMTIIEHHEQRAMSPVVATGLQILEKNPNPETLRELLKVQQDWEANEARKAYTAALVALKRDLPTVIQHDKMVSYANRGGDKTTYTHATLAHVMDEITPALTQHGFSLTFHPTTREGRVYMTCRLTHSAGHYNETTIDAPFDNSGGKNSVQAVGSAITYLQRYSALALLGIATAGMDDADDAPPAPMPDKIDSQRNLRAVGQLKKYGKTREQAEKFLDNKKVQDWTEADLKRLEAWAKPPKSVKHSSNCPANIGEACECGSAS